MNVSWHDHRGTRQHAILTTDHPASSYGLPVVVRGGVAYGPAEVGPLSVIGEADPVLLDAARAAGYEVAG